MFAFVSPRSCPSAAPSWGFVAARIDPFHHRSARKNDFKLALSGEYAALWKATMRRATTRRAPGGAGREMLLNRLFIKTQTLSISWRDAEPRQRFGGNFLPATPAISSPFVLPIASGHIQLLRLLLCHQTQYKDQGKVGYSAKRNRKLSLWADSQQETGPFTYLIICLLPADGMKAIKEIKKLRCARNAFYLKPAGARLSVALHVTEPSRCIILFDWEVN